MAVRFIKASVIYFAIGVSLGLYMGMMEKFSFTSAHAHINLLGWASLALSGLIYNAFPNATHNKLASTHFWCLMIGVPLLVIGMFLFGLGVMGPGVPFSIVGGLLVVVGVIVFAINVFKNLKTN